jgi:hypothetical protein
VVRVLVPLLFFLVPAMATEAVNNPQSPTQLPLPNSRPASHDSAAPTAVEQPIEKTERSRERSIESGSLKEKSSEDDEIVYPSGLKLGLITFGLSLATFVVSTLIPALSTSIPLNLFIGSTR